MALGALYGFGGAFGGASQSGLSGGTFSQSALNQLMRQSQATGGNLTISNCTFSGGIDKPAISRPKTLRQELQAEVDDWLPKLNG